MLEGIFQIFIDPMEWEFCTFRCLDFSVPEDLDQWQEGLNSSSFSSK